MSNFRIAEFRIPLKTINNSLFDLAKLKKDTSKSLRMELFYTAILFKLNTFKHDKRSLADG